MDPTIDLQSPDVLAILQDIWKDLGGESDPFAPTDQTQLFGEEGTAGEVVGPTPTELESLQDLLQWGPNFTPLFVAPPEPPLSPVVTCIDELHNVSSTKEEVEEVLVQDFSDLTSICSMTLSTSTPPTSPPNSESTLDFVSEDEGEFDEFWDQTLHDLDSLLNTFIVPAEC
jgi:hypothetical protein